MKRSIVGLRIIAAVALTLSALFVAVLFAYTQPLGVLAGICWLIIAVATVIATIRARQLYCHLYDGWKRSLDPQDQATLAAFPMPAVAVAEDGEVLFYNDRFKKELSEENTPLGLSLFAFASGISAEDLKKKTAVDTQIGEHKITAFINHLPETPHTYVLYCVENTDLKNIAAEYTASRPVVLMLCIDNLEEATGDMRDSTRARIVGEIETVLDDWASELNGILRKLTGDRFIAVVESRYLNAMTKDRFSVLDRVRAINVQEDMSVTLSIGVGQGQTMQECETMARQALEMALARGGDQAAIKTVNGFDFYGGRSKSVERRTKVRTRVMAHALCDLIRSSDRVVVMGHRQSDLDSLGSAIALAVAIQHMGKNAVVAVHRRDTMAADLYDRVAVGDNADLFSEPEALVDGMTSRSLLIITDTHAETMLDSTALYETASRVAIIDHHRRVVNHIQDAALTYNEPSSSSACELVTELIQYMGDGLIGRVEAEALLSGIMLDTRNFVLNTGARTFEAAAYLRRLGADTVAVKKLFSGGLEMYRNKSALVSQATVYKNTAIVVADADYSDNRAVPAQAADELLAIQGIKASFVLCLAGREVVVSARSYGECNVQLIMESLGGGGHLTMAGAQLKDCTLAEVEARLRAAIDDYLK